MQINIKSNIDQVLKRVRKIHERQVPFATAVAMTKVAKRIEVEEKLHMQRVFNNPTRYTLGAQYVKPATRRNLRATVWLKGSNRKRDRHYLDAHVYGGERENTNFEKRLISAGIMPRGYFAIPGRHMPRGRRGNVTRGMYQKVLAQLQANRDTASNASSSARSKRRRRNDAFFLQRDRRPPGIWMRKGNRVFLAFLFVPAVRYSRRFKFFPLANKVTSTLWQKTFDGELAKAIRTAR